MATNPYAQYNTQAIPTPPFAPYVQAPMPQFQMPTPQYNRQPDMIWVQGEAGMKAYMVAPNTRAILWDQDNPVIYIKTADANGVVSVKTLDYTERGSEQNTNTVITASPDAVTRNDLDSLRDDLQRQINRLDSRINNMRNKGGQNNG